MKKVLVLLIMVVVLAGCTPYESARIQRLKQVQEKYRYEYSILGKEIDAYTKQNKALRQEMENMMKAYKKNLNDMVNFVNGLNDQQLACWNALIDKGKITEQQYDRGNKEEAKVAYEVAVEKFIDGIGFVKAKEWFSIDEIHQEFFKKQENFELKCKAASAKRQELFHKVEALRALSDKDFEIMRLENALLRIGDNLSSIEFNLR